MSWKIDEALESVGNDSIKELFEFVSIQREATDPNLDLFRWVETTRTAADVGLAIYRYYESKERICRESKN